MGIDLLSIVIPVYNSAPLVEELYMQIAKHLEGQQPFELILVDDGSSDESWDKITALKNTYGDRVRGVRLAKNFGQHNAIVCGFTFAQGDAVITMDDDLQHPPSEIPKLIQKYIETKADVVYGLYGDAKKHSAIRNAGSQVVQKSGKFLNGNSGYGSSFRLIKREVADRVAMHKSLANVFIDEILHWYTSRFVSVPVEHHPRKSGKSGYSTGRLIAIYYDLLINYSAFPLKVMTWVGLISSFLTFGLGVRFIYKKLVHDVPPGFTAQIVTILFSTSLLMFCMGILGQYMHKIYVLQSKRPAWTINEVV